MYYAPSMATVNLNLVTETGHSVVNTKRDIRDSPHSAGIINSMRGLQDLCDSPWGLLLRQTI